MTRDATFEEGGERPLNLGAQDADDLRVISSLVQDAVFPITEMQWQARQHRFAMLLNRFRWEDAARDRHAPERVQSLLVIDNVVAVSSQGIDRGENDLILSVLAMEFTAGKESAGDLVLTLAGDGALRLKVEALDITLKDVTRPYVAPSGKTPDHPE